MKKLFITTMFTTALMISSLYAMDNSDPLRATFMAENLEYQFKDVKAISWDTYAYIGYDINKLYIYSEGEKANEASSPESENQLVFSRAISPYWDIQFGLGYDKNEDSSQTWGLIGVQGLAPYFFETRATLLVGEDGNIGIRIEFEYEALLTQRLVLSPSIELSAYTKDTLDMGIGSGLSNITLGARLRYEFVREFAPYVGVEWSKNYANTEELNPFNEFYSVAGLRFWF